MPRPAATRPNKVVTSRTSCTIFGSTPDIVQHFQHLAGKAALLLPRVENHRLTIEIAKGQRPLLRQAMIGPHRDMQALVENPASR